MNSKTSQAGIELSQNKQFTTKCDASGYHRRISIKNKRRSKPKTKTKENPKKRPNPTHSKEKQPGHAGGELIQAHPKLIETERAFAFEMK
jgi:hypothetical protein